jgi:hypothetical protein
MQHALRYSNDGAREQLHAIQQLASSVCIRPPCGADEMTRYARGMWRCVVAVLLLASSARAEQKTENALPALLAQTDHIAKQVAKVRGLKLKHAIPNEVVDHAELHRRLVALAADKTTAAQTAAEELAAKRWGLVPLDYDFSGAIVDLMTDQIAGYYDSKTKKLTIVDTAGTDPDWAEMVFAHELDHGLQDQAFDLEAFEKLPDAEGDASAARHALVEGDGVALMIEVAFARLGAPAPWADPEVAAGIIKELDTPNGDSLDAAPYAIREAMEFPYRDGFAFVAALRRRHPWSAIDAAFKRPPRSTEQILHVDKYLADEKPIVVPAATLAALPGYAIAHDTVWGELGFRTFLRAHGVAERVAAEAAAGWGGDRAVVLAPAGEQRSQHVVAISRSAWDSDADAHEAQAALEHALDDTIVGATAEQTPTLTRWLALDGTVSWVERSGTSLVVAIGVPAYRAAAVAAELHPGVAAVAGGGANK